MMHNVAISCHSMVGEAIAFAVDLSGLYQKQLNNGVIIEIAPELPTMNMQSYMMKKANKGRTDSVYSYIFYLYLTRHLLLLSIRIEFLCKSSKWFLLTYLSIILTSKFAYKLPKIK